MNECKFDAVYGIAAPTHFTAAYGAGRGRGSSGRQGLRGQGDALWSCPQSSSWFLLSGPAGPRSTAFGT